MRRLPCSVALAAAFGAAPAFAQVKIDWTARHAAASGRTGAATAIAVDRSGAVYAAGGDQDWLESEGTLFVARYASDGTTDWVRTYDGPLGGREVASAAAIDGSGSLYVAGYAAEPNPHNWRKQKLLLKYAADGTLLWARQFGREADGSVALAMALDGDHRILLAGWRYGLLLAAVDDHGTLLWETPPDILGHGDDMGRSLAIAPDGDVVVVGVSNLPVFPRGFVARFDGSGNLRWAREIRGPANPSSDAVGVAIDATGTAYVAVTGFDVSEAGIVAAVAFDVQGNALWFRELPGTTHVYESWARGIALDPFGRVVVGGSGAATLGTATDVAVGVFERDGTFVWSRLLDDPAGTGAPVSWEQASGLRVDAGGNVWISGTTSPSVYPLENADGFAAQYDPQGVLRCATGFSSPPVRGWSYDEVDATAIASDGALVVAGSGQADPGPSSLDAFVVRWSRTARDVCFGDGSSAACPCSNASAPVDVAGCRNSSGGAARLLDRGASSLASDTFELVGSSLLGTRALFVQGTTGSPAASFGDGLRCAGGAIVRLGVAAIESGRTRFPRTGEPSISVRGGVLAPASRTYQIVYRDAAGACRGASSNLTNALVVEWTL